MSLSKVELNFSDFHSSVQAKEYINNKVNQLESSIFKKMEINAGKGSSLSDKITSYVMKEKEQTLCNWEIFICTKLIDDIINKIRNNDKFINIEWSAIHHWGVLFTTDHRKLFCELTSQGEGKLIEYNYNNWNDSNVIVFPNIIDLELKLENIGPVDIANKCKDNKLNNKPYEALNLNCQHWVKQLLGDFGLVVDYNKYKLVSANKYDSVAFLMKKRII